MAFAGCMSLVRFQHVIGSGLCHRGRSLSNKIAAIHCASTALQPKKIPLSEEEKKLLEKIGLPDEETWTYLNVLYRDFGVLEKQVNRKTKLQKGGNDIKRPKSFVPDHKTLQMPFVSPTRFFSTSSSLRHAESINPSMKASNKKIIEDGESLVIWSGDVDELNEYYPEHQKVDPMEGMDFHHGEEGVFDVEDIVNLLKDERLQDVVTISVPKDLPYADYLVICTAMSVRQAKAVCSFIKKVFKRIKHPKDCPLKIEGETCKEWKVLDMGNIVVHIFDEETREKYDLETLWTVGFELDDLASKKDEDGYEDVLEDAMLLVRSLRTSPPPV